MTKYIRLINNYKKSFNFNNDLNEYLKFRKDLIKNFNELQKKISINKNTKSNVLTKSNIQKKNKKYIKINNKFKTMNTF